MFIALTTMAHTVDQTSSFILMRDGADGGLLPESVDSTFLIPHWRRDNCIELLRLHLSLKHPESSSLSQIVRKSLGDSPMPPELKKELESMRCSECAASPDLPRKPKLALQPEATPNSMVSLNFMTHKIQNTSIEILVMIDHGDRFLKLKKLNNRTAVSAFNDFYSRRISYFDAPTYVLVDRGSNLAAELMKEKLQEIESQLCPVPTGAHGALD